MKKELTKYRFMLAAGGTGGHLYPAIAVAEQILKLRPEASVLFVGTRKKLEARIIPKLKYQFKTLWISGFSRKFDLKNLLFPIKLFISGIKAIGLVVKYKPQVVIGAGAYVAGPVVWAGKLYGAKAILLEQNSYPGITNRLLEKKADKIYVSFEDSKKYFRFKDKLQLTGNPVRINLKLKEKRTAKENFSLNPDKKVLLILGGSLGAASINFAVNNNIQKLLNKDIQIIWQAGELYYDRYKDNESEDVKVFAFMENIEDAYSACDLVIARAGATTIAELAYLGLPVIFIPSPNVAANHQYKNAKSLLDDEAALLLSDNLLEENLVGLVEETIFNEDKLERLSSRINKFSNPDAAKTIAEEAIKLAERN
jgi:UDP-N-acetylglucosamine--N-acetylmuramyl-(pentapeptide) pyrophosphoryl-undecaprenol N-acetylglucosamine transferase